MAPTLDELCEALGLRSRGSMHKHIMALAEAGLVEPMNRKQRGVRLVSPERLIPNESNLEASNSEALTPELAAPRSDGAGVLPLYGTIAAGRPIEALRAPETVEVPATLRSEKPCYVLKVQGDSMIDEGILDGDYVVVEHCTQAHNGDIVVALIDGEEATLKRILQRPEEIVLCPSNADMQALRYAPERVSIQGVVVGQMRRYR